MQQNGRNVINQFARGGGLVLNDNESEFITWGRANTWSINVTPAYLGRVGALILRNKYP